MQISHKMEKNKGITIVALVVTIIILMILAGITITAMKRDKNGIVTEAMDTKEKAEIAEIIEKAQTEILLKVGQKRNISEEDIDTILARYGTISGEGENRILTTEEGYKIPVSQILDGII